jgi:hypothetical protein
MDTYRLSRCDLLQQGSAALAGLAFISFPWLAQAFPNRPSEEVMAWADQPPANPVPQVVGNLQPWEELDAPGRPRSSLLR